MVGFASPNLSQIIKRNYTRCYKSSRHLKTLISDSRILKYPKREMPESSEQKAGYLGIG